MKKLPQGKALWKMARELGISTTNTNSFEPTPGFSEEVSDAEVQRRLMEFYRSRRESRLWIIALVSAIASVLSAAAAIIAVLTV